MADKEQLKQTTAEVLGYVEKAFSFASTFNPMFGIVTSLVHVVRKGLVGDEANELYKDFQQIHDKLESISEQNKQLQSAIIMAEIDKNYGDMEKNIEHQYRAFKKMVDGVRKEPENGERYRQDFRKIYIKQQGRLNLKMYCDAITENSNPFGRPLLEVYLKECKGDKKIMEARCDHLAYLFHIGLIALMAYYVITEDDVDEFKEEWGKNVNNIQAKMKEALDKCSA